jgi:hypothetical protein
MYDKKKHTIEVLKENVMEGLTLDGSVIDSPMRMS